MISSTSCNRFMSCFLDQPSSFHKVCQGAGKLPSLEQGVEDHVCEGVQGNLTAGFLWLTNQSLISTCSPTNFACALSLAGAFKTKEFMPRNMEEIISSLWRVDVHLVSACLHQTNCFLIENCLVQGKPLYFLKNKLVLAENQLVRLI